METSNPYVSAHGLIVDSFAGGGGASLGIERALGRPVDLAINHDVDAIAMHRANHPQTVHLLEDVWKVDPIQATKGRPIELLWASPDCKHFSRAKGAKPVEKRIRGLAWVVVRWARDVRPAVICLENVREFEEWGPLNADNRPSKRKRGLTFRRFVGSLRSLGYEVDWRILDAADYGAATHRRRLFLVARCDSLPIVWPAATHGPGRAQAWRGAHEIIDWSLPCPSIFGRQRPLAEATMRRIAFGLRRFVFESAEPFFVETANGEREGQAPRVRSLNQPMRTARATGSQGGIVVPHLQQFFGGMVGKDARAPLPTVTSIDHNGLAAAFLTKFYGTSTGSSARAPLPTTTAQGQHLGEVRAFLLKWYGTANAQDIRAPLHTQTARARFGLVLVNGEPYQVVDIGLRMLTPRELARAQGFPDSYVLTGSKTSQIARIGNSVCPVMSEALARANCPRLAAAVAE